MTDITKRVRELSTRNPNLSLRDLVGLLAECGQELEIIVTKRRKPASRKRKTKP